LHEIFLFILYLVHPGVHPFSRRNSTVGDDTESHHSKVIFMKMDRHHTSPPTICTDDEDDEEDCPLIESASIFVPFMSEREERAGPTTQLEVCLAQQVHMRHVFESTLKEQQRQFEARLNRNYQQKTDLLLAQIQPLEARLRHETKARADLESMMSRVIDQLHAVKVQLKEQAEQKRVLQVQLDKANQEIRKLTANRVPSRKAVIHKK
jgi:hypothetical protein